MCFKTKKSKSSSQNQSKQEQALEQSVSTLGHIFGRSQASFEVLSAMLAEYSELRQEIRNAQAKQTSLITSYITVFVAIFTLAANLYAEFPSRLDMPIVITVFFALVPFATTFMGAIYLDQVYRQVKLGVYISDVESNINRSFPNTKISVPTMGWEHWAQAHEGRNVFTRINHYNYYVCLMLFLVVTPVSVYFGLLLIKHDPIWSTIGLRLSAVAYSCYFLYAGVYMIRLFKLFKKIPKAEGEGDGSGSKS
jgi:hypothetical protein